jgi:hypothetical protein
MAGYQVSERIYRSLSEVFDFVATHQVENHPKWEPEVVSIRKVTDGPAVRTAAGRPVPSERNSADPSPHKDSRNGLTVRPAPTT